ncbi:MAG TPA: ABC transporter permease, partial [Gemmatimonadaceae bacterium]
GRSWTVMIVAQVAAAVIGIPFAATAVRGIRAAVDPRFATSKFLVARLFIDGGSETVIATRTVAGKVARLGARPSASEDGDRELVARFANLRTELVRRLSAQPGIVRVVASSSILGDEREAGYEVEADSAAAPTKRGFRVNGVEPDYFDAFDVPILLGRRFTAGDATAAIKPVIVNQSFVNKYLGGVNPLGRRVRPWTRARRGDERQQPWQTIVGVVADFPTLSDTSLGIETRMFLPLDPSEEQSLVLNVRVAGSEPATMTSALRDIALAVSPSLRVVGVAPLVDRMNEEMAPTRLGMTALLLVVASVVILSAAGMYALMSVMVTRRRREIGIRVALGAGGTRVIMSVLIRAAMQIGIGVTVGIAVLFLIIAGPRGGRLTAGEFGNLVTVVGSFAMVGLVAAIGPARRALRIQPTEALRVE